MTPETLLSLADRVCAGREHDIVVDRDVCIALQYYAGSGRHDNVTVSGDTGSPWPIYTDGSATWREVAAPLTGSLDAVEALRARMLPGSGVDVFYARAKGEWFATMFQDDANGPFRGIATTEPRARLAAILRALAAGG